MCGRTALTASPEDLRVAFGLDEAPRIAPHYNVPPSQPLYVIRAATSSTGGGAAERKLEALRWGLVPWWAKDQSMGHKLALARLETADKTPAFRDAIRRRRCLVAVDSFYEWQRHGKKASLPFVVRRADGKPFALAGVWDRWVSKDGEVIESCAIVTQPARPPVDAIHDRMPLVLSPARWAQWLDAGTTSAEALAPLLAPQAPDLVAYAVSTHVNDPRHDDPACQEPSPVQQQSLF
jgi:putative SOS response-associated peptidase YedK